jgi:hypothetical protein
VLVLALVLALVLVLVPVLVRVGVGVAAGAAAGGVGELVLVVWKPVLVLVVVWKRLPVVVEVGGGRPEVEGVSWQVIVGWTRVRMLVGAFREPTKEKKNSRTHVRIIVRVFAWWVNLRKKYLKPKRRV